MSLMLQSPFLINDTKKLTGAILQNLSGRIQLYCHRCVQFQKFYGRFMMVMACSSGGFVSVIKRRTYPCLCALYSNGTSQLTQNCRNSCRKWIADNGSLK